MFRFKKNTSDFTAGCGICGSRKFRFDIGKNGYEYAVCSGCGTSILNPVPSQDFLRDFYGKYESEGGIYIKTREESKEDCFNTFDLDFSDLGFSPAGIKKALDIGCATGIFLEYLKSRGISAKGVDVSAEMVARAREKGLDASSEDLFSFEGKFNMITLWDVLEHFTNPAAALKKVNQLLEKDGNLVIETPCRGFISDYFGPKWRHYNPPQHIYLFSRKSLFYALRRSGFHVVSWVRFGSGNTSGGISPRIKSALDFLAKKTGIGDSIVVWAKKSA